VEQEVTAVEVPYGYCHCGCGQKTNLVNYNDPRTDLDKGEPRRFVLGHNGILSRPSYTVNSETGCWDWDGKVSSDGYATSQLQGRAQKVHRVFYEQKFGLIPEGLVLDHLCRNRRCVNPDHLEVVTQAVNTRRGLSTTLTEKQVQEIRLLAPTHTYRSLADRFGVGITQIHRIRYRKQWRES